MQITTRTNRSYWATVGLGVAIGLVYLIGFAAGGKPLLGVGALAVMVAFSGALVLAGRRSETVRGLLDHRDERISAIDLRATAVTALAMIAVILVGFVVSIARGGSGWPYDMIGFVGGLAYVAAVVFFRARG
ncbi:MAG TPA: hypothetical protein VGH77_17580 [Streptosporangiaceae bacterium]|jgi:hypothetical protein